MTRRYGTGALLLAWASASAGCAEDSSAAEDESQSVANGGDSNVQDATHDDGDDDDDDGTAADDDIGDDGDDDDDDDDTLGDDDDDTLGDDDDDTLGDDDDDTLGDDDDDDDDTLGDDDDDTLGDDDDDTLGDDDDDDDPVDSCWSETQRQGAYSELTQLTSDREGNIYGVGMSKSDNEPATPFHILLVKYSPQGILQWTRTLRTDEGDSPGGIAVDAEGFVYFSGMTKGDPDGEENLGDWDGVLAKYAADGTRQWTRSFGTSSGDRAHDLTVGPEGKVFVAGATAGTLLGETPLGLSDFMVTVFDSEGTQGWARQVGHEEADTAYAIRVRQGSVFVAGTTYGAFPGHSNLSETRSADIVLAELAPTDGSLVWTEQFGLEGNEYEPTLEVDAQGSLYVGATNRGSGHGTGTAIFVRKYSSSKEVQWSDTFATGSNQTSMGLELSPDGSEMYVVGTALGPLDSAIAERTSIFLSRYTSASGSRTQTRMFGSDLILSGAAITLDSAAQIHIGGGETNSATDDEYFIAAVCEAP